MDGRACSWYFACLRFKVWGWYLINLTKLQLFLQESDHQGKDWRRLSKTYEKHWKTAKVLIESNWMFGAPAVNVTVMATPAKLLDGIIRFQKKMQHANTQQQFWPRRVSTGVPAGDAMCRFCKKCEIWRLHAFGLCIWTCGTTPDGRFDSPFAPGIHQPGLEFASNSRRWIYSSIQLPLKDRSGAFRSMIDKTNMLLNESIITVSWAGLSRSYLFLMIPFSRVLSQMGQQDGTWSPASISERSWLILFALLNRSKMELKSWAVSTTTQLYRASLSFTSHLGIPWNFPGNTT